jgi:hypothetical protein
MVDEKLKRIGTRLDKEIALLKFRFVGGILVNLFWAGIVLYLVLHQRVYVISKTGGIWESQSESRDNPQILFIEADDHMRKFYSTFLSFTHLDYKEQTGERSYGLGGNIIKEFRQSLVAKGFYNDIVVNNYRVVSTVDKVKLIGLEGDRLSLTVTGSMVLKNDYIEERRAMNLNVVLVIIPRVAVKNPHGLSIEDISLPDGANVTLSKTKIDGEDNQ